MKFPAMCDQQSLRSACAYAQSDQSRCSSLEHSMTVRLLTEHYLEFLSLKGGCTGSSESTTVKMPRCWKSHVTAQIIPIFEVMLFTLFGYKSINQEDMVEYRHLQFVH